MTAVILVEGTWGGDWAQPGSPFTEALRADDLTPIRFQGWSGNVDGVPIDVWQAGKHRDWIAGGYAFADRVRVIRAAYPLATIACVCHSHGINPVLYGLSLEKVAIDRLVSVCSPVRRDMQTVADDALPQIGRWRHVASKDGDMMQKFGELFDGHLGWGDRSWRQAHENLIIPGIGHSKLLNDPKFLDLWRADGMIDFLKAEYILGV